MSLFFFIMLFCIADTTQGAQCTEGQHCSDCDLKGGCLQDCDKGFYGLKCQSQCSSRCRYSTCKLLPGKGTYTCTAGCVPGYHGIRCERPCDSHVISCTLCPGGCDGEYCQLGDACFTGCRDSRYGSGCKTCPSNCRTCNRMTGVCDECEPGHYGVNCEKTCENCEKTCENCEKTCENCAGACEPGCECVPGFYGDFCAETCSKTCRPKSGQKCLPAVTSDSCTGECDKHSAVCLHGCVDGWFGPMCSTLCNPGCRHQRCNEAGSCVEGCQRHHFGTDCEPCPENCANQTCDSKNGSCVGGCRDGFYGEHCNETCTLYGRGVCDQTTGACVTDCSEEGSESDCTQTCSTPGCSTGYRKTIVPELPRLSSSTLIWVLCAAVLSALVAGSACWACYRRPCVQSSNRSRQAEAGAHNNVSGQADDTYTDHQDLHKYWEIREDVAEMKLTQNHESKDDGSDDAVLVLADCFPGGRDVDVDAGDGEVEAENIDIEEENGTPSSSDPTPHHSYTHLTMDAPVADPRAVVSYISPLDD